MNYIKVLALACIVLLSFANAQAQQVIGINIAAEPETLDPALAYGVPEHVVSLAILEGLIDYHPKTLEPIAAVAKSWQASKDGKTYTFKLRADAKWSTGEAVTAQDFVYAWKRVITPATASPYATLFHLIVGAKEFSEGKTTDFSKVGVKAISPTTFVVELRYPAPYFPRLVAHYTFYPVHKKTVEKYGKRWTRPENFVGNGAFTLKHWRQNDRLTVEKSPTYWDKDNVKLSTIHYYPIENQETAFNLYKTGKIHWTGPSNQLPPQRINQLKKRDDFYAPSWLTTYFYRFNTTKAPFDNVDVRRAFHLAVDRTIIVEKVTQAGEKPVYGIMPLAMPDYQAPKGQGFAPKEAARHLAKAGYCAPGHMAKSCKKFPKIEILYNTSGFHKKILLALQQMWKRHLGIEQVQLNNREWKVYLTEMRNLDFMIARGGWAADFPDPISFLEIMTSASPNNQTGWKNADFDKLVEASFAEPDKEKRAAILMQAEQLIVAEQPILPVFNYSSPFLLKPNVRGFYENYQDIHPPKWVYLESDTKK